MKKKNRKRKTTLFFLLAYRNFANIFHLQMIISLYCILQVVYLLGDQNQNYYNLYLFMVNHTCLYASICLDVYSVIIKKFSLTFKGYLKKIIDHMYLTLNM